MRSLSTCPSNISNSTFQERLVFTYSGLSSSRLKGLAAGNSGAIYVAASDDLSFLIVTKLNADLSHNWTNLANQISYENTIAVSDDETYIYQGLNYYTIQIFQMSTTDGSMVRIFSA